MNEFYTNPKVITDCVYLLGQEIDEIGKVSIYNNDFLSDEVAELEKAFKKIQDKTS